MPIPLGVLAVAGAGSGAAASSFDLLETTVLGSDTASVTFSSLGSYSDYKHLQIRTTIRGSRASSLADVYVRLNSDTGANYANHQLRGNGTNVLSSGVGSTSTAHIAYATGSTFTASGFAANVIDILDFSNSSKNTTLRCFSGMAGTNNQVVLFSTLWNNTAAVTSITLLPEVNNFVSGSRFSLYGIK